MDTKELLSTEYLIFIIVSIIVGTISRVITLKEDFRQYPSYPNGYLIHLVIAFVASSLGAVAIPALLTKNFVAVTFLTLAIQQFRDVRKMEKDSLQSLEETEYAYRGAAYIDGIAKTFEARNYLVFISSLTSSITMFTLSNIYGNIIESRFYIIILGVILGFIILFILKRFTKGKTIGDIAEVNEGKIEIKDSSLYVDDIYVSNLLGTDNAEKLFKNEGLAVVISPKQNHFRINLDNYGQRQAALFEATRALGVKRYHFTRKDYNEGKIIITLVPIKQDIDALIEVIKKCPLLESTKKAHSVMKTNIKEK